MIELDTPITLMFAGLQVAASVALVPFVVLGVVLAACRPRRVYIILH